MDVELREVWKSTLVDFLLVRPPNPTGEARETSEKRRSTDKWLRLPKKMEGIVNAWKIVRQADNDASIAFLIRYWRMD